MTTTPFGDAPQLGNEVLEDEEELKDPGVIKPLVEEPKKEQTLRDVLPKSMTDSSVMKKTNVARKFWHTITQGEYHPSQINNLKIGDKPYLDHTKAELGELSTRDFAKMYVDRSKDDAITEWNTLNENIKEKNWGQLITRPIYLGTRAIAPNRDWGNTAYLGIPTAITGTASFLTAETFPRFREPI